MLGTVTTLVPSHAQLGTAAGKTLPRTLETSLVRATTLASRRAAATCKSVTVGAEFHVKKAYPETSTLVPLKGETLPIEQLTDRGEAFQPVVMALQSASC